MLAPFTDAAMITWKALKNPEITAFSKISTMIRYIVWKKLSVIVTRACVIDPIIVPRVCDIDPIIVSKVCDMDRIIATRVCDIEPIIVPRAW